MAATIFKHTGDFDALTKSNRALRFVHKYFAEVTSSLKLNYPDTEYYAPSAVFFDTKNVTYTGAKDIKKWMLELFSPFEKLSLTGMSFFVVDESTSGKSLYTVNAETMVSYYVKGDPVPISVPRMFVFEIKDDEDGQGWDRLQFFDIKLYWDTALLVGDIKRRKATT
ncbi:hypothetical protein LSUB1_G002610 [Lachnellula subtilissima]|uniref:SnoaL-like domain-containing protein n=1 Tax=Lachnellula subtilissima TaxID=602034 RepID=A0A8H8UBB7_9HELO|nr:hypothetical protein LSUB1_G002610 [Lachnellula subtilissima]